jgi:2Fe-2S ferredoxin
LPSASGVGQLREKLLHPVPTTMVDITFIGHEGAAQTVDVDPGMTLMEAAAWNRVRGIFAACGGKGGCATCHVYLDASWEGIVCEKSGQEAQTLRYAVATDAASRLACFIRVTGAMSGLSVRMPKRQF